jgi:RNA 2',3'-cyclic 3'-phosphodiesterase
VKFIGSWPDERLEELKAALASIPRSRPVSLQIRGLGFRRKIFLCGIDAPGLAALATATEKVTASLGIERETRAYFPHLTIARIKTPCNLRPLRAAVQAIESCDFGSFEARSFFLYQSQLRPGGSVYTKLAEFPLSH